MALEARDLARIQAAARVVAGASLLLAPAAVGRVWVGRDGRRPAAAVYSAALGIRDAALGAGALRALQDGGSDPGDWLRAGVISDSVDLVVTVARRKDLPAVGVVLVVAMAGTSAALGTWLTRELGAGATGPATVPLAPA